MDRKNAWIVAGALVVGFFVLGLTQLFAQRFAHDERTTPSGAVGRYQVVRASAEVITLLDTVTGDLYNAVPTDLKPYNTRPRGDRGAPAWGAKEKGYDKEKPAYTDKDGGKDRNFKKTDAKPFYPEKDKGSFSKDKGSFSKEKSGFSKEKKEEFKKDAKSDK
jgi:hypothetical protein